jgi:hypothetical protein
MFRRNIGWVEHGTTGKQRSVGTPGAMGSSLAMK